MPMSLIERTMLCDCCEEGEQALSWYPPTFWAWYPKKERSEILAELKQALADLLARGFVIYARSLPDGERLQGREAIETIDQDAAWLPPQDGGGWVLPTEDGVREFEDTDLASYSAQDALKCMDECDDNDLAVYALLSWRVEGQAIDKESREWTSFEDSAGSTWSEFRRMCNSKARQHILSIPDRAHYTFYPVVTSRSGPNMISPLQRS